MPTNKLRSEVVDQKTPSRSGHVHGNSRQSIHLLLTVLFFGRHDANSGGPQRLITTRSSNNLCRSLVLERAVQPDLSWKIGSMRWVSTDLGAPCGWQLQA